MCARNGRRFDAVHRLIHLSSYFNPQLFLCYKIPGISIATCDKPNIVIVNSVALKFDDFIFDEKRIDSFIFGLVMPFPIVGDVNGIKIQYGKTMVAAKFELKASFSICVL